MARESKGEVGPAKNKARAQTTKGKKDQTNVSADQTREGLPPGATQLSQIDADELPLEPAASGTADKVAKTDKSTRKKSSPPESSSSAGKKQRSRPGRTSAPITQPTELSVDSPAAMAVASELGVDSPAAMDVASELGVDSPAAMAVASELGVDSPAAMDVASELGVDSPVAMDFASELGVDSPVAMDFALELGVDSPVAMDVASELGVDSPVAIDVASEVNIDPLLAIDVASRLSVDSLPSPASASADKEHRTVVFFAESKMDELNLAGASIDSVHRAQPARPSIETNAHGCIIRIYWENTGEAASFIHDSHDGKTFVSQVSLPDGTILESSDGHSYQNVTTGQRFEGSVEIGEDGSFEIADNRVSVFYEIDGSVLLTDISGGFYVKEGGVVTKRVQANGIEQNFRYFDGKLIEITTANSADPATFDRTTDGTWLLLTRETSIECAYVLMDHDGTFKYLSEGIEYVSSLDGSLRLVDAISVVDDALVTADDLIDERLEGLHHIHTGSRAFDLLNRDLNPKSGEQIFQQVRSAYTRLLGAWDGQELQFSHDVVARSGVSAPTQERQVCLVSEEVESPVNREVSGIATLFQYAENRLTNQLPSEISVPDFMNKVFVESKTIDFAEFLHRQYLEALGDSTNYLSELERAFSLQSHQQELLENLRALLGSGIIWSDLHPQPNSDVAFDGYGDAITRDVYKEYSEGRELIADLLKGLRAVALERLNLMTVICNRVLDELHMPRVGFVFSSDLRGLVAHYRRGAFEVRWTYLLDPSLMENLAGFLAHELVHVRRDYQIVRNLLDEHCIGQEADEEQLHNIQELYSLCAQPPQGSEHLSIDFIKSAIMVRKGQQLSAVQAAFVHDLEDQSRKYHTGLSLLIEVGNDFRIVLRHLTRLKMRGLRLTLEEIDSAEVSMLRHLFDSEQLPAPVERMIHQFTVHESEPTSAVVQFQIAARLKQFLGSRKSALSQVRKEVCRHYLVSPAHAADFGTMPESLQLRVRSYDFDQTYPYTNLHEHVVGTTARHEPVNESASEQSPLAEPDLLAHLNSHSNVNTSSIEGNASQPVDEDCVDGHSTDIEHDQSMSSELGQATSSELGQATNIELEQATSSELGQATNIELEQATSSELGQATSSELGQATNSELEQPTDSELEQAMDHGSVLDLGDVPVSLLGHLEEELRGMTQSSSPMEPKPLEPKAFKVQEIEVELASGSSRPQQQEQVISAHHEHVIEPISSSIEGQQFEQEAFEVQETEVELASDSSEPQQQAEVISAEQETFVEQVPLVEPAFSSLERPQPEPETAEFQETVVEVAAYDPAISVQVLVAQSEQDEDGSAAKLVMHCLMERLADEGSRIHQLVGCWKKIGAPAEYALNAALSLYPRVGADPAELHNEIDRHLIEKGLGLPSKLDGHISILSGDSHRVTLMRELWPVGEDESGRAGALVDRSVTEALHRNLGVNSGGRIPIAQIRAVESQLDLQPNTLTYAANGKDLILYSTSPASALRGAYQMYLDDSYKGTVKTDRRAMYALSTLFGVEPAEEYILSHGLRPTAKIYINGKAFPLETMISIGRSPGLDLILDDPRVSRQHSFLYGDKKGKVFVLDNNSSNGVFVDGSRIPCTNDFRQPHWFQISDVSVVTMGGVDGPQVVFQKPQKRRLNGDSLETRMRNLCEREGNLLNAPISGLENFFPALQQKYAGRSPWSTKVTLDCAGRTMEALISPSIARYARHRQAQEIDVHIFGIVVVTARREIKDTRYGESLTVLAQECAGQPLSQEIGRVILEQEGEVSDQALLRFVERSVRVQEFALNKMRYESREEVTAQAILDNSALKQYALSEYQQEQIVRYFHDNTDLSRALGESLVERAILGDVDESPANFLLGVGGEIRLTNLDFAFNHSAVPIWLWGPQKGFMNKVMESLSLRRLPDSTIKRIEEFVTVLQLADGHQRFLGLGLTDKQLEGIRSRAQWFIHNKTFPKYCSEQRFAMTDRS